MTLTTRTAQTVRACALASTLLFGFGNLARAQEDPAAQAANTGLVLGLVARCVNGAEIPAAGIAVGTDPGSAHLTTTNGAGEFFLPLAAGQYDVVATGADGSTAFRWYVPVEAGQSLDVGTLDLGGGLVGCAPAGDAVAPILPTSGSTVVPTSSQPAAPAPAGPTAAPQPAPAATDVAAPADSAPPADVTAPEDAPPPADQAAASSAA